jgi:cytochrome c551/c552
METTQIKTRTPVKTPAPVITIILLTALALSGCDEKIDYKNDGLNFDVDQDLQTALQQRKMPILATRLGCTACHAIDHRIVGPAWEEVGKRYRNAATFEYQGKSYPVTDGLVQKVSHGGSGHWGVEQMPAMDPGNARHALLEKLVHFILETGKR